MPQAQEKYGTLTAIAISLGNLAHSGSLLDGQQSDAIDNTSGVWEDFLLTGKIRAGSVAPTANAPLEIWAYSLIATSTYQDTITGTNGAVTLTSINVKQNGLKYIASIPFDITTGRDYYLPQISMADIFGRIPTHWGIVVINGTGQALDSNNANHFFNVQPIRKEFA